jgi:hypothetical protein
MSFQDKWNALCEQCPIETTGSPKWVVWMRAQACAQDLKDELVDRLAVDAVCAFAMKTSMTTAFIPAQIPDGRQTVNGNVMMYDAKGGLMPVEMVKPQHLLEDELVRKVLGHFIAASGQIGRLKAHTVEDIDAFTELLAQEYGITPGGKRGNMTLNSYDGLFKVEVRISDFIDFGPELQIAKTIVDACLNRWSVDASPEIRAIVTNAFNTEAEGKVNRSELIKLTRLSIDDEEWGRGMKAIKDAQRVTGSKQYIRAYQRERFDGAWRSVSIDMARA